MAAIKAIAGSTLAACLTFCQLAAASSDSKPSVTSKTVKPSASRTRSANPSDSNLQNSTSLRGGKKASSKRVSSASPSSLSRRPRAPVSSLFTVPRASEFSLELDLQGHNQAAESATSTETGFARHHIESQGFRSEARSYYGWNETFYLGAKIGFIQSTMLTSSLHASQQGFSDIALDLPSSNTVTVNEGFSDPILIVGSRTQRGSILMGAELEGAIPLGPQKITQKDSVSYVRNNREGGWALAPRVFLVSGFKFVRAYTVAEYLLHGERKKETRSLYRNEDTVDTVTGGNRFKIGMGLELPRAYKLGMMISYESAGVEKTRSGETQLEATSKSQPNLLTAILTAGFNITSRALLVPKLRYTTTRDKSVDNTVIKSYNDWMFSFGTKMSF